METYIELEYDVQCGHTKGTAFLCSIVLSHKRAEIPTGILYNIYMEVLLYCKLVGCSLLQLLCHRIIKQTRISFEASPLTHKLPISS